MALTAGATIVCVEMKSTKEDRTVPATGEVIRMDVLRSGKSASKGGDGAPTADEKQWAKEQLITYGPSQNELLRYFFGLLRGFAVLFGWIIYFLFAWGLWFLGAGMIVGALVVRLRRQRTGS